MAKQRGEALWLILLIPCVVSAAIYAWESARWTQSKREIPAITSSRRNVYPVKCAKSTVLSTQFLKINPLLSVSDL